LELPTWPYAQAGWPAGVAFHPKSPLRPIVHRALPKDDQRVTYMAHEFHMDVHMEVAISGRAGLRLLRAFHLVTRISPAFM
jgi:hypothetical protein